MQVSEQVFRRLVDEALWLVPAEFRPYLDGVVMSIQDWPSEDLLAQMGIPEGATLRGLYSGRPLIDGSPQTGELPARITIYRGPLSEGSEDEESLREEIATTVLHEIAHHFGIGEERLRELGWG